MRGVAARLVCALLLAGFAPVSKQSGAQTFSPTQVVQRLQFLQRFTTLYVHSDTVYMKNSQLEKALLQRPEVHAWGLELSSSTAGCDAALEVKRPFLTFDWTYTLRACGTGAELATGKVVAWDGAGAALQLAAELVRRIGNARPLLESLPVPGAIHVDSGGATAGALKNRPNSELLRDFHRLYVRSDTVYMKSAVIQSALQARSELQVWGVILLNSPADAEMTIEITRPFLTFDWRYRMLAGGVEVGTGKVVAWDGAAAAPQLARIIVERIKSARALPAGWETETRVAAGALKEWHGNYVSGTENSPGTRSSFYKLLCKQSLSGLREEQRLCLSRSTEPLRMCAFLTAARSRIPSRAGISSGTRLPSPMNPEQWWVHWHCCPCTLEAKRS